MGAGEPQPAVGPPQLLRRRALGAPRRLARRAARSTSRGPAPTCRRTACCWSRACSRSTTPPCARSRSSSRPAATSWSGPSRGVADENLHVVTGGYPGPAARPGRAARRAPRAAGTRRDGHARRRRRPARSGPSSCSPPTRPCCAGTAAGDLDGRPAVTRARRGAGHGHVRVDPPGPRRHARPARGGRRPGRASTPVVRGPTRRGRGRAPARRRARLPVRAQPRRRPGAGDRAGPRPGRAAAAPTTACGGGRRLPRRARGRGADWDVSAVPRPRRRGTSPPRTDLSGQPVRAMTISSMVTRNPVTRLSQRNRRQPALARSQSSSRTDQNCAVLTAYGIGSTAASDPGHGTTSSTAAAST